jgi:hypothetical protein
VFRFLFCSPPRVSLPQSAFRCASHFAFRSALRFPLHVAQFTISAFAFRSPVCFPLRVPSSWLLYAPRLVFRVPLSALLLTPLVAPLPRYPLPAFYFPRPAFEFRSPLHCLCSVSRGACFFQSACASLAAAGGVGYFPSTRVSLSAHGARVALRSQFRSAFRCPLTAIVFIRVPLCDPLHGPPLSSLAARRCPLSVCRSLRAAFRAPRCVLLSMSALRSTGSVPFLRISVAAHRPRFAYRCALRFTAHSSVCLRLVTARCMLAALCVQPFAHRVVVCFRCPLSALLAAYVFPAFCFTRSAALPRSPLPVPLRTPVSAHRSSIRFPLGVPLHGPLLSSLAARRGPLSDYRSPRAAGRAPRCLLTFPLLSRWPRSASAGGVRGRLSARRATIFTRSC